MAKGYMIANLYVRDKEGFEKFREMAKPVLEEYYYSFLLYKNLHTLYKVLPIALYLLIECALSCSLSLT